MVYLLVYTHANALGSRSRAYRLLNGDERDEHGRIGMAL